MRGFMFLLKVIAFILFCWYGNKLYKDIVLQEKAREVMIEKNTQDITDSFLIRDKEFFNNKDYEKKYKTLKEEYRKKEEEKRLEEERKLEEEKRLEEERKLEEEKLKKNLEENKKLEEEKEKIDILENSSQKDTDIVDTTIKKDN